MDGQQQQQLVSELCRVQELVRELDLHLHAPYSSYSVDQCRRLAAEIVALTDRSIGIAAAAATPPCSGAPSPLSDAGSDPHHQFSPKRRKAAARWSGQVRVGCAADDGHSWRKYGQKDILGAMHPRAYYRCTHRNSQGCPATKQVQRTDDDPAAFDVVYHGDHTCRAGGARRTQTQHNPHAEGLLQGLGARLAVATDSVAADDAGELRAAGRAVAVVPGGLACRLGLQQRVSVPNGLAVRQRTSGGGVRVRGRVRRAAGHRAHAVRVLLQFRLPRLRPNAEPLLNKERLLHVFLSMSICAATEK